MYLETMRDIGITKLIIILVVVGFCICCGFLVAQSGLFNKAKLTGNSLILLQNTVQTNITGTQNPPAAEQITQNNSQLQAGGVAEFGADHAPAQTIILGAADPNTEDPDMGFKLQLELSTKGAAIRRATFSDGNDKGFNDLNPTNPHPLNILLPIVFSDGSEILSMANKEFVFVDLKQQLSLQDLQWRCLGVQQMQGGSQSVGFEAVIKNKNTNEPVIKLTKTYAISPRSYIVDCNLTVENLSAAIAKIRYNLNGPSGIEREDLRSEERKAVAGFKDSTGRISRAKLDTKQLIKGKTIEDLQLNNPGSEFLWAAVVDKYFAGILVPLPQPGMDYCNWVMDKTGRFYNPDMDTKAGSGDETIGIQFNIAPVELTAAAQAGSSKMYNFQLYIGPKDKSLFDKNKMFRDLGFVQTIDFMSCCCPASLINPLAFGILAIMKWMYGFWPYNYGIVIIILVFLMRLILHPVTKKSSVAMSKMSKLAPRAEEIKKKYANNKQEMNKQMMLLYREQGASPIMGFLPMLVQMPIWIALWSAVYTSIDLRGASFLPFWMTDLSAPDALIKWPTITIPWLEWHLASLNLLPILMGVAFYLQQKLMPTQANASTNPQMAQQQKMMMIMMPLLFPLMMYNQASGVNLYIMASTFAGVIEQYVIRKHIQEKEEAESIGLVSATSKTGGKVKKKKPKPFFKT
jgi:YidC/Oxa1 family membrane protein insertase